MTSLRPALLTLALTPLLLDAATAKIGRPARPGPSGPAFPETEAAEYAKQYDEALAGKVWDKAVSSLVLKTLREKQKLDDGEEAVIRAIAEAADTAPEPMRAPLRAILAHQYKAYYDRHRWELRGRTAGGSGDAIGGWDAVRLLKEIDRRFQESLADYAVLQKIPVADYAALMKDGGPAADALRPTLYDFLAYDAFAYYTDAARAEIDPSDAIMIGAESPLLATRAEFLAWKPAARADDPAARAVAILKRLYAFHAGQPDALAEVELTRWRWARAAATGDRATARIREGLTTLAGSAPAPAAANAYADLAELVRGLDDPKGARALADKGRDLAPGTPGAARCENIVRDIEAPEASLRAERVWNSPWPRFGVVHKNLPRVYLRVVKWNWKDFLNTQRGRPEWLNDNEKKSVMAAAPVKSWAVDLPPTPDFKLHTDRFPVPEDLAPGFYFLVASFDENFSGKNNRIFYTDFWVSKLAVVADSAPGGKVAGRVLDALSGEPVAGATVSAWYLSNSRERRAVPEVSSGADGAFTLESPAGRGLLLLAKSPDGEELGSMQEFSPGQPVREPAPKNYVSFYTDRAIYRPGQTLRFKGVVLRDTPAKRETRVISGRTVTVALDDPNGKEVARIKCVTNDYGAFDGAFEAPRDRLTGTYALHTIGNENGRNYLQVEEYKRPTFEVKFDPAAPGASLSGPVALSGVATTYVGTPVDGAKVTWRVTRVARWPRWCWWFPGEPTREIASGEAITGADGRFKVAFDAVAPAVASRDASPVYDYNVTADVTDIAGETRSADRSVPVGRVDRTAELADGKTPGEVTVQVSALDGGPVAGASGKLVVKRLDEPAYVHRARLEVDSPYLYQEHLSRIGASGADVDDGEDETGVKRERLDLSNPRNWAAGATVATLDFKTDDKGAATVVASGLKPGHYRVFLETKDGGGKPVKARFDTRVLPESGDKLGLKVPFVFEVRHGEPAATPESPTRDPRSLPAAYGVFTPGETLVARWGTGYESGRALLEIHREGKPVETRWTTAGKTLEDLRIPITDADIGGFTFAVSQVRENRFYRETYTVDVPKPDMDLVIGWEHFTDKLTPGAKETWTAVVKRKNGEPVPAEIVATLYDASLDAYAKLDWPNNFRLWERQPEAHYPGFLNLEKSFRWMSGEWTRDHLPWNEPTRRWDEQLISAQSRMYMMRGAMAKSAAGGMVMEAPVAASASFSGSADSTRLTGETYGGGGSAEPKPKAPSLENVVARGRLEETAFFIPRLESGKDGVARFEFTVPESLTRWRFLAFAHDKALRTGLLEASAVTALDLMVRPNPPRFLREGDSMEIPVKLINRTDKPATGKVRLNLADVSSGKALDASLGNTMPERTFAIPANGSVAVAWKVRIPDGCPFVNYTVRAASDAGKSDGESGWLPVLSRRIPVTESKAASLIGPGEVAIRLDNLAASGASDSLRSTGLRVDTVARPSWYAVLALPYLMEFPHECSEQLFHRYYANLLAAKVANDNPELRATFDRWRGTDALDSPLEKNADIKGISLEETPWVREAASESQQHRQVALLFDKTRLNVESASILKKLEERRLPDGGWPWFPGGESSTWVTRTVVLGLGRLRALGALSDAAPAIAAIPVLDRDLVREFEQIKKNKDHDTGFYLSAETAHTLQARGYFLKDLPIPAEAKPAYDYFLAQAAAHWPALDRASQARLALSLGEYGDTATPDVIVKSLRERSVSDGDKGMRWNDAPAIGWWRPWVAPIETQALMVEVFETVAKDAAAADACRLALLANKRTNAWPTTTSTAEACYAMLMRGTAWTAGSEPLAVTIGGVALTPEKVEPGTGATSVSVSPERITPAAADIVVKKPDAGPAWASVHWSYLEDSAKVKSAQQSALSVKKTLWKKILTTDGPKLLPVEGNRVQVGDELVVRLEVTNDRDLQFVHIKDGRPACLEPGIALSGFRWTGALGYYEAIRDTATHRFVEYLPKGTHVFEFSSRAAQRGECRSGLSEVRCMYAPEFEAHGEAPVVTVE